MAGLNPKSVFGMPLPIGIAYPLYSSLMILFLSTA